MFTAIIHARRGPEALALTLSALVAGVAQGVVADAVVVTQTQDATIKRIAEQTGATFVTAAPGESPWRAGAAHARRDWLFLLEDGDVPLDGWTSALDRHAFAAAAAGPMLGRLQRRPAGLAGRVKALAASLSRRPRAGDLVHRSQLAGAGKIVRVQAAIVREAAIAAAR